MRTSRNQRRKVGKRWDRPIGTTASKTKGKTLGSVIKGLSADMSLSDLVRHNAAEAEKAAKAAAEAAGKSASGIRGAMRRARAASLRASAKRAGVGVSAVRKWAAGGNPRSAIAKAKRASEMRAAGGAGAVRSAVLGSAKSFALGNVRVQYDTEKPHWVDLETVTLSEDELAETRKALEEGDEDEAERLLGEALMSAADLPNLHVVEIPNMTIWT